MTETLKSYLDIPCTEKEETFKNKHKFKEAENKSLSPISSTTPKLTKKADKPPKAVKAADLKPQKKLKFKSTREALKDDIEQVMD